VPPIDFVRAAERYRLMGLVDRWVVQTTLAALGRGALAVPANRSVAINISGQDSRRRAVSGVRGGVS